MSAHTPGPWTADKLGNVWEGSKAPGTKPSDRADALRIALADISKGREEEDRANARLIAAAPTMFAFIGKRAAAGDADAQAIKEAIDGHA